MGRVKKLMSDAAPGLSETVMNVVNKGRTTVIYFRDPETAKEEADRMKKAGYKATVKGSDIEASTDELLRFAVSELVS